MDTMSLIIGAFGATTFIVVLVGIIFFINILIKAQYKYLLIIKNTSAGQTYCEAYEAKRKIHPMLGEVYYIPRLRSQNREYVLYFGNSREYPLHGKGRIKYMVPVCYHDGTYAPEEMTPFHEEIVQKIVKTKDETKKDIFGKATETYHLEDKKIMTFITKPTKSSMRQFNLEMDTIISAEYAKEKTFLEKYGAVLLAFVIILSASALAMGIIWLATEHAETIPTLESFSNSAAEKTAQILLTNRSTIVNNALPLPLAPPSSG